MNNSTPRQNRKDKDIEENTSPSPIRSGKFSIQNQPDLTPSKIISNVYKSPAKETWAKSKRDEIDDFISYAVENLTTSDLRYLNSRLEGEGLSQSRSTNTYNFKCAVCLQPVKNFTIGTCGHTFCRECIEKWLESSNQCPKCHCSLSPKDIIVPKNSEHDVDDSDSEPIVISNSLQGPIYANKNLIVIIIFIILICIFLPFV